MRGAIHNFLNNYFKRLGLSEDTLSGKMKMRSIRIQISLNGINLTDHGPDTMDDAIELEKVKSIIESLNISTAA